MVRISLLVICSVTSKLVFECLNVLAPLPLCGNIKNLQRWCRSTGAASSGNCKGEIAKCVGERHMFDNTNQKHSHTLSSALSVKDLTFPFKSLFWNLWLQAQKTVCRSLFAFYRRPATLSLSPVDLQACKSFLAFWYFRFFKVATFYFTDNLV